jgi:hypothetical protein
MLVCFDPRQLRRPESSNPEAPASAIRVQSPLPLTANVSKAHPIGDDIGFQAKKAPVARDQTLFVALDLLSATASPPPISFALMGELP